MDFGTDPLPEESAIVIDLTSMVDVLFVLLLFFMVTTTFSDTSSIPLNLPAASKTSTEASKKDLSVTVYESGLLSFSDGKSPPRELSVEGLGAELAELKQKGGQLTLVIRADKLVHHGIVVAVLDQAKKSGVEKIAIAAEVPVGAAG